MPPKRAHELGDSDPTIWQAFAADVSMSLSNLDDDDLYKTLERGVAARPPAYAGQTLDVARDIVGRNILLLAQYSVVNNKINEALQIKGSVPSWAAGAVNGRVQEILLSTTTLREDQVLADQLADLLPSRKQNAPSYPIEVPLQWLLASLPDAIAGTSEKLDTVRAAVATVDNLRARFEPALAAIEREAAGFGMAQNPEILKARSRVAAILGTANADPLGVVADLTSQTLPVLGEARAQLADVKARVTQLRDRFGQAGAMMQQWRDDRRRSIEGAAETPKRIAIDSHPMLPPATTGAQIAGHQRWLDRIVETYRGGDALGADASLTDWFKAVAPLMQAEAAVAGNNYGPVDRLNMLRGRVEALQATALAYGRMRVVAPPGSTAARVQAAYTAVCAALKRKSQMDRIDLDEAARLVDEFARLADPPPGTPESTQEEKT